MLSCMAHGAAGNGLGTGLNVSRDRRGRGYARVSRDHARAFEYEDEVDSDEVGNKCRTLSPRSIADTDRSRSRWPLEPAAVGPHVARMLQGTREKIGRRLGAVSRQRASSPHGLQYRRWILMLIYLK